MAQSKFGWHFENPLYRPDCLEPTVAEKIRNDGPTRRLLEEEMETLTVQQDFSAHCCGGNAWLHHLGA